MRKVWALAAGALLVAGLLSAVPATARTQRRVVVEAGRHTAAPSFVSGLRTQPSAGSPASVALAHLRANFGRYRIADPQRSLRTVRVERLGPLETARFAQLYRGIPVLGAQYLVHMRRSSDGLSVTGANGHYFTGLSTTTEPRFSKEAARSLALARMRGVRVEQIDPHGLTIIPDGPGILTYHFTVWGARLRTPVKQEVFINASTGALALSYNNLQSDGIVGSGTTAHGENIPLNVFQNGSSFEMHDVTRTFDGAPSAEIFTHDAQGVDGNAVTPNVSNLVRDSDPDFQLAPFGNHGAVDAHSNSADVFEFYKALGRNSIDDAGLDIVSMVNAGDTGNGPLYNAFWNGDYMTYGNPNPSEMFPLSADLDVVGHELTHGVTQYSAELFYLNESGAMNEAYSDYFGNAIDVQFSGTNMSSPQASTIGEDLCRVGFNDPNWACPLRDMNDGSTTADFIYLLPDFDNGGVHINSTIYSGALWNIREAVTDPHDADEIVYLALSQFENPLDDFVDGRDAVVAAAQQLVDQGLVQADAVAIVTAAFEDQGIVEGWDTNAANDSGVILDGVVPLGFLFSPPQVSGDRYVIGDYSDPVAQFGRLPEQIYAGNVADRAADGDLPVQLSDPGPSVLNDEQPDISGARGVWARVVVAGNGLDLNLVSARIGGTEKRIAGGAGFQWFPSIDGRRVAYENATDQTDIRAVNVRSGKVTKVTKTGGEEQLPQIKGDTVAWWDLGNFGRPPRIGIKNLVTRATATIKLPSGSSPFGFIGPPGLSERFVYWFQDGDGDGEGAIMRANLKGKRRKALVRESSARAPLFLGITSSLPVPSGNDDAVVYIDERNYLPFAGTDTGIPNELIGRDVWQVRSAPSSTPQLMTCNPGDQAYASMDDGKRAVWLDASQGKAQLMTRARPAGC